MRTPEQPELAIGAFDQAGAVLTGRYFGDVSHDHVREEVRTQREIIRQRRRLYTQAHPAIDPAGGVAAALTREPIPVTK